MGKRTLLNFSFSSNLLLSRSLFSSFKRCPPSLTSSRVSLGFKPRCFSTAIATEAEDQLQSLRHSLLPEELRTRHLRDALDRQKKKGVSETNNSVVESAWLDRKQKLKFVDFDEIPTELDAVDTFQLEELQLKETQGASSSLSINATHSEAHGKATEEPSSCVGKHTTLNKVQDKVAIETSLLGKNNAIHSSAHGSESASNEGSQHEGNAKSRLHEICAANHWEPPSFICCKDEGPSHYKLFTFKVTVQVEDATRTVLECFSRPRSKKKVAAEHAAEGALWCLQHLRFKI